MQVMEDVLKKFGVAGLIFIIWFLTYKSQQAQLSEQSKLFSQILKVQADKEAQNFRLLQEMIAKLSTTNERLGNIELGLKYIDQRITEGRSKK